MGRCSCRCSDSWRRADTGWNRKPSILEWEGWREVESIEMIALQIFSFNFWTNQDENKKDNARSSIRRSPCMHTPVMNRHPVSTSARPPAWHTGDPHFQTWWFVNNAWIIPVFCLAYAADRECMRSLVKEIAIYAKRFGNWKPVCTVFALFCCSACSFPREGVETTAKWKPCSHRHTKEIISPWPIFFVTYINARPAVSSLKKILYSDPLNFFYKQIVAIWRHGVPARCLYHQDIISGRDPIPRPSIAVSSII